MDATNPFRVGRMVYPSLADALAAVERAHGLYPLATMQVFYTPTGEAVHTSYPLTTHA